MFSLDLLPHRFPFFFIDRVEELVSGEEGVFQASWSMDNFYLSDRIPPSFFQVLLPEMMAQAAGLILLARESLSPEAKNRGGYLLRLDNLVFPRLPVLGEGLRIAVKKTRSLGKMQRFSGRVHSGEALVAQGNLTLWQED